MEEPQDPQDLRGAATYMVTALQELAESQKNVDAALTSLLRESEKTIELLNVVLSAVKASSSK